MIEIHFEELNDAAFVYAQLEKYHSGVSNTGSVRLQEYTVLIDLPFEEDVYIQVVLIPVLIQFILKTKEYKWIMSVLSRVFYYHDIEEHNEILHIAHSIMNGSRKDIPKKGTGKSRDELLFEALQGFIQNPISFSFESLVRFRLKPYMMYLLRVTELAIDEYKLEQDYQTFIETLRQHVSNRKARLSSIHLVFNGDFIFYDEKGGCLNQEKLVQYIDEKIVKHNEFYIDANVIAPLVSIAPEKIHLYTAYLDDNMVVTIQNVFQERVKVYSVQEFEKKFRAE
ncbi:putative sporulation protein YtxC [Bacillus sp. 165]|uniref:putative sporulation protein YtxC n=1 Tax=Bacillus sp. 165 TaxID=1529117 RepID=UPI001ADB32CD|nr:putative sporulation protein YtxC [Bacillus sp. 165]